MIDRGAQYNYFIGRVLPFVGWKTRDVGPMKFTGFYTAWLGKGVCWSGTLSPRDK